MAEAVKTKGKKKKKHAKRTAHPHEEKLEEALMQNEEESATPLFQNETTAETSAELILTDTNLNEQISKQDNQTEEELLETEELPAKNVGYEIKASFDDAKHVGETSDSDVKSVDSPVPANNENVIIPNTDNQCSQGDRILNTDNLCSQGDSRPTSEMLMDKNDMQENVLTEDTTETEISKEHVQDTASAIPNEQEENSTLQFVVSDSNHTVNLEENVLEADVSIQSVDDHIEETEMNRQTDLKSMTDIETASLVSDQVQIETEVAGASAPVLEDTQAKTIVQSVVPSHVAETEPTAPVLEAARTDITHRKIHPKLDESLLESVAGLKPFTQEQLRSLYYNAELDQLEEFTEQFLKLPSNEMHGFQEILLNNYRARTKLKTAELDLRSMQTDYERLQGLVWSTSTHTITAAGTCLDKTKVSERHMYEQAVFHENVCADITKVLSNIRTDLHDELSLHAYSTQLSRLQVESYIHSLISDNPLLRDIPRNAPVQAVPPGYRHPNEEQQANDLRTCISILFNFQRKPIKDENFLEDTRLWLDRLIGTLLRVATFQDQLFLLCHILRCPSGVGKWASKWVQPPCPSVTMDQTIFGSPVLDHFLAMLAMLILPIKDRDIYLRQLGITLTPENIKTNPWTLVDSDGEEEDEDLSLSWKYLHENDLMAILDQFPMEAMYRHILFVDRQDEKDLYDICRTSEHSMLRLFAFSTCLVELLGSGLNNFTQTRFRQLNKRLGNMIRHTVQFCSDHWENFKAQIHVSPITATRLQIEFDHFFLRAMETILSAQRLGSWQFIADMPFTCVSVEMMWKLVWLLHFGQITDDITPDKCRTMLLDPDSRLQFEEKLLAMSMSESVFLLTALAGMAQRRPSNDHIFIETVTQEIYEIAYVAPHTREFCSKTGRELLSGICSVHSSGLSVLLRKFQESAEKVGMVSLYLFKELPLLLWHPTDNDMEILQAWLLHKELTSAENQLARLILSGLNWGFNEQESTLALPLLLHRHTALLVVEALYKQTSVSAMAFITDGVKQVTSVVKNVGTDYQQFTSWAWSVVLKLRLHLQNQCGPVREDFRVIPNLKEDATLVKLQNAVQDGVPIACYLAVMMTTTGHNHVEFCCDGLAHIHSLVTQHHYQAVIQVLAAITPMFYDKAHYLIENERYLSVLQCLLSSDPAYTTLVMSFLYNSEVPEQVTKCIFMIQAQIQKGSYIQELSPTDVIQFWLSSLININRWYTDRNTLYVIDSILQSAFVVKGGDKVAEDIIYKAYQHLLVTQKGQNMLSSFMSWLATGSSLPSFLDKVVPSEFPWFTYFALLCEARWEQENKLWPCLLEELKRNPRNTVELALKKVAANLKLEMCPAVHRLSIYRWSVVTMEIDMGHPVNPLLWQQFYQLFLHRPITEGLPQRGSIGEKFFESTHNITLLKKMKKCLKELAEYHHEKAIESNSAQSTLEDSDEHEDGLPENVAVSGATEFHTKLVSLYQTFKLWLDEPRLHDGNLYLPALPVQYGAERLQRIFQGDKLPWLECVDLDKVEYQLARSVKEWTCSIFPTIYRDRSIESYLGAEQRNATATEKILLRLKPRGKALAPPSLVPLKPPVPAVPAQLLTDEDGLMQLLKPDFTTLTDYAKRFSHKVSRHIELDCNYGEFMPDLYGNELTEVVLEIPCRKSFKSSHVCQGPAVVHLRYAEKRRREMMNRRIQENRSEYRTLLSEAFLPPPQHVCTAAVHVENAITSLIKFVKANSDNPAALELPFIVGRCLFYNLVTLVSDVTNHYPPCRQFFSSCIDILGVEFISNHSDQSQQLLETILCTPSFAGGLAVHFTPIACPEAFVTMYERVIPNVQIVGSDVTFMILTKFDVYKWLQTYEPSSAERSQFASVIMEVLCVCGADPEEKLVKIFEIGRNHLKFILHYKFPELYGEVLALLLKGSSVGRLHVKCWENYLNCLGCTSFQISDDSYKHSMLDYRNSILSLQQVSETLEWLSNYFHKLRHSDSNAQTFGLYPTWSRYVKAVSALIGFLCGCLIDKAVVSYAAVNQGPEMVISRVWQEVINVFSPWIAPIDGGPTTHPPWVESDTPSAHTIVTMLVQILLALHKHFEGTLPAYSIGVLSLLFDYYAKVVACRGTPEYVLEVFHGEFPHLPWNHFRPNVPALDLMTKLCDQSHPDAPGRYSCLRFLATVIPELPWAEMIQFYSLYEPADMTLQFHACLLQLLIQLVQEKALLDIPSKNNGMSQLLVDAEQFYWHFLDDISYRGVTEIFLMNCNPRCVLAERTAISAQALRLLRVAAAFLPASACPQHHNTLQKQRTYIQTHISLLCQCTKLNNVNIGAIKLALSNLMTDTETMYSSGPQIDFSDCVAVVSIIINLLNTCANDEATISAVLTTFIQWLESSPCSVLLLPTLSASGKTLLSTLPHMVLITECCIESYFNSGPEAQQDSWSSILAAIEIPDVTANRTEFIAECLNQGGYLTLFAYVLHQLSLCESIQDENAQLVTLVEWTQRVKPSAENEAKLLLWWFKVGELCLRQVQYQGNIPRLHETLDVFIPALNQLGEDRITSGLLGAIGFGRRSQLSLRFRLLCRSLCTFVMAQLPDAINLRITPQFPGHVTGATGGPKPSHRTVQALSALQSLKTKKEYKAFHEHIDFVCNFIRDPNHCLNDLQQLICHLKMVLFSEIKYLCTVRL